MVSKERVEKKMKGLSDELNKKLKEIQKMQQELGVYQETLMELDPDYIKVDCPQCRSKGYVQQDKSKVPCQVCGGSGYLWMKKFSGEGGL